MGYTIPGLAKQVGVTPQTVRNWVSKGMIPSHIAPSGRTFFTDEDVNEILNKTQNTQTWAHYARSSCGSKTVIQNQLDQLQDTYGTPKYTIKDTASGLNEKRKGLKKLLDLERQENHRHRNNHRRPINALRLRIHNQIPYRKRRPYARTHWYNRKTARSRTHRRLHGTTRIVLRQILPFTK